MEGMVARGVDVTLFATGNSHTSGKLKYISPTAYAEDQNIIPKVWECLHISFLMEQAGDYDLIHNNFDYLPLTYSRLINTPMLTTIHGFSSPRILPVFEKYNSDNYYVSISDADRSPLLNYVATVYNGIDISKFTFNPNPEDYLLFFGRIHPEKGTYESIEIAKAVGRKLIISGLVQDEHYFNEKVKPYIDNENIVYVGNSGPIERDKLLRNAYVLLHPISFNEPFGLSVAEAQLCGTPVIAFNLGSMPELIDDTKSGFLVDTIEEAVAAVSRIDSINRYYVHERSAKLFSSDRMVDDYLKIYRGIIDGKY